MLLLDVCQYPRLMSNARSWPTREVAEVWVLTHSPTAAARNSHREQDSGSTITLFDAPGNKGAVITDLAMEEADLEDAFVELMRRGRS